MRATDYRVAASILGFTLARLGAELKVSRQTSWNWANGKSQIPYAVGFYVRKLLQEKARLEPESRECEWVELFEQSQGYENPSTPDQQS